MNALFTIMLLLLFVNSNALYLRVREAGNGKRVGLPLASGFILCPNKFGQMTVECGAPGAKYVDITASGITRREWNAPFTFRGDYPGAVRTWNPRRGMISLKCMAFTNNGFSSVEIKGLISCPPELTYVRNATHVVAVMKKPSPSSSPASTPMKKQKPIVLAVNVEPEQITAGMRLRLVHVGFDGDKKTIAVLKDGFKVQNLEEKSVVCDAPAANKVTFFLNKKKWRVETVRPFSINGDVGRKILKWKNAPSGQITITCVCQSGMKVSVTGTNSN